MKKLKSPWFWCLVLLFLVMWALSPGMAPIWQKISKPGKTSPITSTTVEHTPEWYNHEKQMQFWNDQNRERELDRRLNQMKDQQR